MAGIREVETHARLLDWRDGWFAGLPRSVRSVERSHTRGRIALMLMDNLGICTPKGWLLLRQLLDGLRGRLVLVYTRRTIREVNRNEWRWRSLRRAGTHTRETLPLPAAGWIAMVQVSPLSTYQ